MEIIRATVPQYFNTPLTYPQEHKQQIIQPTIMIRMVPATHATTKNHGLAINRIKTVGQTNGIHIVGHQQHDKSGVYRCIDV